MPSSPQNLFSNIDVADKFNSYPKDIRVELMHLRAMIFEVSQNLEQDDLEEALKWGQPSYLTKKGSTLRIDWKGVSKPNQFAMYFNCKSKLIDTFREVFPHDFKYEGNRAIVFTLDQKIPTKQLKLCIELSLTYHSIKNLPLLGV